MSARLVGLIDLFDFMTGPRIALIASPPKTQFQPKKCKKQSTNWKRRAL